MKRNLLRRHVLLAALFVFIVSRASLGQTNAYIRINQAGYLPADTKIAIAFSKSPLRGDLFCEAGSSMLFFVVH
jgi:hypothetical protein